jgi:hypothetical protein
MKLIRASAQADISLSRTFIMGSGAMLRIRG